MLRPKPLIVNVAQTQGMDSRSNAIKMEPTKSAILYNVDLSSPGKKAMRLGTTAVLTAPATAPVMGLCYLKGGGIDSRMTMVTNKRFYKSTLPLEESGSWTDVSGADQFTAATYPQAMQEAQGSVWCSNGTDSVFQYNGTSMTEYPMHPKGKVMSYFKNRLWIANVSYTPQFLGAATVFTGSAGSMLKVIAGGTTYDNIDLSSATTIDNVVTLLNAVISAKAVAVKTTGGFLRIYSKTSGSGTLAVDNGSTDTNLTYEALYYGRCTAALATDSTANQITAGAHYYAISFYDGTTETISGVVSNTITNDGTHTSNSLTAIPLGPSGTTSRKLYRTAAGGSTLKLVATIADNTTTTYTDTMPDANLTLAVSFTGGGLNDATSGGTYTGSAAAAYYITVQNVGTTDTFKWRKDSGTETANVSMTGGAQTLSDGVTVTFAAITGHTAGNSWTITTVMGLGATIGTTNATSTTTSTGVMYPDFVYYSDVIDPTTFDMTNNVIKVYSGDGTEVMAMRPFLESSLLIFKEDSIHELLVQGDTASYWNLRPVDLEHGCIAYNCTASWGSSIFYLSRDGVRVIQANAAAPELPLSWDIKGTWDTINFDYISRAKMVVHNNKLYVAVPTGSTAYNDKVLVYDLTVKGWSVYTGWNVGCFGIHVEKVLAATADEEEILMYGDVVNGKVYKCYKSTAFNDLTTAIAYQEDTKRFDFDYPYKKIGDYVDFKILSGTATNVVVSGITDGTTTTVLATSTTSEKLNLKGLGRFTDLQLRFATTGTSTEQLIMGEYTIFAKPCGYRRT